MLTECLVHLALAPDTVFVEQASISGHIERKLLALFGEQNRRLAECVGVAQLVEDVLVDVDFRTF